MNYFGKCGRCERSLPLQLADNRWVCFECSGQIFAARLSEGIRGQIRPGSIDRGEREYGFSHETAREPQEPTTPTQKEAPQMGVTDTETLIAEARKAGAPWVKDHHPDSMVGVMLRLADALEAAAQPRTVTSEEWGVRYDTGRAKSVYPFRSREECQRFIENRPLWAGTQGRDTYRIVNRFAATEWVEEQS